MAAIIKLSQSVWMKFFCANDGNHSWQVWVCLKGNNKVSESKMAVWIPTWQNSRWLPSSGWVRMNELESDWISLSSEFYAKWLNSRWPISRWLPSSSLSQIELVWVRVRVEWECFWVNLREDNKVSESKMAVWIQHGRVQDGCQHNVESE